jgi:hypothetical protein
LARPFMRGKITDFAKRMPTICTSMIDFARFCEHTRKMLLVRYKTG